MTTASPAPARTILVVDDDPDLLEMVEELLRDAGYRVLTATGADAGLGLARTEQPSLVLMDGSLADTPVVRAMKDDAETRRIPVVALTGAIDPGDMFAAGCLAFIPKPFDAQGFVGLVAELLEQTVNRRPGIRS